MKHQQTLVVLVLGGALTLSGFAETYTSASYVQREHLIAQWDGIDNAGTGRHDPNAAVWKDLRGNLDMTLTAKGRTACSCSGTASTTRARACTTRPRRRGRTSRAAATT